jgi:pilus assembly protein CpaE
MTSTINSSRVILIGDPGPTLQQITSAFDSQTEFQMTGVLSSPDRLAREIGAAKPNLILLDHQLNQQPTIDIIDDIAVEFPDSPIVAILPDNDPLLIQKAIMGGARAFLVLPFTQINLLNTLRRVLQLENNRRKKHGDLNVAPPESSRPLRSLVVFSPRGGVGCSTLAVNLALAMQEELDKKVLLLDGKQFFGHLDVLLNIRTHNTLIDLIPHASNLDETLVHDVVVEHGSGIHVLLGPSNIQVAHGLRPDDLYTVMIGLQRFFDLVVIDAGSSLSENTVTLMDASDRIILIATPDLASLRDVSRFIQISQSLSYPSEKLLVVLNREGHLGGVKTKDIEVALKRQVFAKIPEDVSSVQRSLNRGIPLMLKYPRSPTARALKKLSKALCEMQVVEHLRAPMTPVSRGSQMEALMVSSQFG